MFFYIFILPKNRFFGNFDESQFLNKKIKKTRDIEES